MLRISTQLFRILTPKLSETRVDSKKDMETELKNACETLIQEQIQSIALPLVEFNAKISEKLEEKLPSGSSATGIPPQTPKSSLGKRSVVGAETPRTSDSNLVKDIQTQSFMQRENLEALNSKFLENIRTLVPTLCAKMRLYLTNKGGNSSSSEGAPATPADQNTTAAATASTPKSSEKNAKATSTFHILFRPIHSSLVESVSQLHSLFQEFQIEHQFISRQDLDREISSIVEEVDKMEYNALIGAIEKTS